MRKQKIYLDTSVINFVFADDAPDFQRATIEFFRNIAPVYALFISDIVLDEINEASDQNHRNRLLAVLADNNVQTLPNDNLAEVQELAKLYLQRGLFPQKKMEDALHVAFTTIYEIDFLLSWNFRHLANINKEEKILLVNSEQGYRYPLRIISPLEVYNEP
jgi:hypothetical protein